MLVGYKKHFRKRRNNIFQQFKKRNLKKNDKINSIQFLKLEWNTLKIKIKGESAKSSF